MDLAKIVYKAKVDEYIDFVNGDKDEAFTRGGWCGVKRIEAFDNDNLQFLVGQWGGEGDVKHYAISEWDERIGDFCEPRLNRRVGGVWLDPTDSDYIECIARMLADFIIRYEDYVSETITVDLPDEEVTEICPHCDHENVQEVREDQYIVKCDTCGKGMHLCHKCLGAEDNPSQKCDWHEETVDGVSYSACFRGRCKE